MHHSEGQYTPVSLKNPSWRPFNTLPNYGRLRRFRVADKRQTSGVGCGLLDKALQGPPPGARGNPRLHQQYEGRRGKDIQGSIGGGSRFSGVVHPEEIVCQFSVPKTSRRGATESDHRGGKNNQPDTAFFSPSDSIDLVVVLSPFKGISFLEKRMTLRSVGSQPLCIMVIFHKPG